MSAYPHLTRSCQTARGRHHCHMVLTNPEKWQIQYTLNESAEAALPDGGCGF